MKKLIRGIAEFRNKVRPNYKETFAQLALGQRPDTLFICCSDSRVAPNVFASTDPGDLFVVRNVGNMIPPCGETGRSTSDESEGAAIEFALLNLGVTSIIVCGHSECGAMDGLLSGREKIQAPNLKAWLRHGEVSLRKIKEGKNLEDGMPISSRLSQLNVLQQMIHLKTYPVVRQRIEEGTLVLHGWWFNIKEAEVYEYEASENHFKVIDDEYASVLLSRAEQK